MKKMLCACVVICSLVSSVGASAQETLTGEDLERMAATIRSFQPKDEFDVPPALPSVEGKRFVYTVTPRKRGPNNRICDGFPSWGYFPRQRQLEVSGMLGEELLRDLVFDTGQLWAPFSTDWLYFRSLSCDWLPGQDYEATNGFGVKVLVDVHKEVVTAIGFVADDILPVREMVRPSWKTITAGDEGRRLARALRLRFSGTLHDWSAGEPVRCASAKSEPTMDFPYEETLDICIFKGRFERFDLIDADTGEIIYTDDLTRPAASARH